MLIESFSLVTKPLGGDKEEVHWLNQDIKATRNDWVIPWPIAFSFFDQIVLCKPLKEKILKLSKSNNSLFNMHNTLVQIKLLHK